MKIWVNPFNFAHAKKLIDNENIDYVIVGMSQQLTCKKTCILSINQIKQIKNNKIVVCLNNFYFENQVDFLTNTLKRLKQIGIKTIIFTDFAVKQICDEINYYPYFVYDSETIVTNYGQLKLYYDNGINEVVLPNVLKINEIKEFSKHKNNVKLQIQAEGNNLIMHSKLKLLANNNIKNKKNQPYYLNIENRDKPNIIIEDDSGSYIFSNYNFSIFQYFEILNKCVDSITFSSYLHNKQWIDKNIDIYTRAIALLKKNKFNKVKPLLIKQIKDINECSTCGFLNPIQGLLNLKINE